MNAKRMMPGFTQFQNRRIRPLCHLLRSTLWAGANVSVQAKTAKWNNRFLKKVRY